MEEPSDIVIVGAGQAGARAAKAARDAGFSGSITMFGEEEHAPYERPDLSKALLKDSAAAVPYVLEVDAYAEHQIELHTGARVEEIDREAKTIQVSEHGSISYDRLLLATGSRLRPYNLEGLASDRLLMLRTLDHCREIERRIEPGCRVAIIGGGFIGLEVAATLNTRGCKVSVIEMAACLLPRLGCAEASQLVLDYHLSADIDVKLGTRVERADGGVLYLDGTEIEVDFVIAGIGIIPQTSLAEAAGLEVDDGIATDEFGRTSDPCIFAAGDVTRHYNPLFDRHMRLESWQNANAQAIAAGRTMAGVPTQYAEVPWLWSDQGDLNLQVAGAPHDVDRTILRREGETSLTVFQFSGARLVGGVTVNAGQNMAAIRRLLLTGELADDPELLTDADVPLRRFIQRRSAA